MKSENEREMSEREEKMYMRTCGCAGEREKKHVITI